MGSRYHLYPFSPQIISHALWVYHRFTLSFRDVEEMLAEREAISNGLAASLKTTRTASSTVSDTTFKTTWP